METPEHLTVSDCARRATVSTKQIRAWLCAPEGTPEHLPSVMASRKGSQRGGRSHYAVQASDLETLLARITTPAPLPLDAITPHAAGELLAAKPLRPRSRECNQYGDRLRAAVARGELIVYRIAGQSRYSQRDVDRLRLRFIAEGIGRSALDRRRARSWRIERERRHGELTVAEVAERCGVKSATVRGWGRDGIPGSRKAAGQYYFDPKQLPAPREPRAAQRPRESRTCAICQAPLDLSASYVARRRAKAEATGRPLLFFCEDHRRTPEARALFRFQEAIEGRQYSDEARARMQAPRGDATAPRGRRIQVTDEDRARRAQRITGYVASLSRKERIELRSKANEAQHGRSLTPAEREAMRSGMHSRALKGKAGRKRNQTQRDVLLGILGEIEDDVATTGANELLALVGLIAWQRGETNVADIPASSSDPESFDPSWRKVVVDRVRRHVGADIKALQIAAT